MCALAMIAISLSVRPLDSAPELIAVAGAVFILGVPHGALDPLFARGLPGAAQLWGWAIFAAGYGLLAAAVVGLWVAAPCVFLAGFLVISAAHFAGDPAPETAGLSRLFYGGAIIVIPAACHAPAMAALFAALAGDRAAAMVMPPLQALAWPWLVLLLLCAAAEARRDRLTGAEMAALGALAFAAPPLIAFATFFCAMHSPRHILRTAGYAADVSKRALWAIGLGTMLIVIGIAAGVWLRFGLVPADHRLVRIMFVGLAALTVPHMMLLERVRQAGWRPERPRPGCAVPPG